jgi:dipeptidyl aminopeptidase/acylaminoacyl peptidase
VYFDQVEIRRNVGGYSDLYALARADGRVRALTRDARLLDPDLSPDGETIVCTQDRTGRRDLVTVRLFATAGAKTRPGYRHTRLKPSRYEVSTLLSDDGTHFDAPKWSPDGRRVAVERHRLGAMPEIVIVDVATKEVRVVAADAATRFIMPAWRPDGAAIVAAVAPEDQVFNLVELSLEAGTTRQLTQTTGGATWPDVSPDGKLIAFVGYTVDGFDVFTVPYPLPRGDAVAIAPAAMPQTSPEPPGASTVAYSPLETLKPTSWFPVVESDGDQLRAGASVGGADVLGYHAWLASATWLVSAPSGSATPGAASPDWQVYYTYDRWRPRVFAAASNQTSFFAGPPSDAGTPTAATRRERQLEAGVVFPIRHVRARHAGMLSILRAVDDFTFANGSVSRNRTPLRASWQTITGLTYGYSISREHGIAAGATAEFVRRELGSFADATTLTGDVRAYLPALAPHHVVAVRVSVGASTGDPTVGRTFLLGGDTPAENVADFASNAFSLLRGFSQNTFAGTRVALVNLEYRWPIARPQRGAGTWPLFLHSIHGALVADAGHAWTRTFRSSAIKTSAGGQLSADIIAGYFAPFTATVGAAWGHDGSGLLSDRVTAYFRVGKAF